MVAETEMVAVVHPMFHITRELNMRRSARGLSTKQWHSGTVGYADVFDET
jgi:hypothetical protein